jgi:hypothetical protein
MRKQELAATYRRKEPSARMSARRDLSGGAGQLVSLSRPIKANAWGKCHDYDMYL